MNILESYFDKFVNVVVNIDKIKEVQTKNGDNMCFITASDELGIVDIVVFPDKYKKYNELSKDETCIINGKVEKRFDKYQLILDKLIIVKD